MAIPNVPLSVIPAVGGFDPDTFAFPGLRPIKIFDSVGPSAANRQPEALEKRDDTIKDATNLAIGTLNYVVGRDAIGVAIYGDSGPDYMPRDASYAWGSASPMNMAAAKIEALAPGTAGTDAVNKDQLDAAVPTAGNFLLRDGTGNMDGSLNMQSDGAVDQQIINVAVGVNPTDGVNKSQLDALASSGGAGAGPGVLVDYKHGKLATAPDTTTPTQSIVMSMDDPNVTMWLLDATTGVWKGNSSEEEFVSLTARLDVTERRLRGEFMFYVNEVQAVDMSVEFDVTLPANNTETLIETRTSAGATPGNFTLFATWNPLATAQVSFRMIYHTTVGVYSPTYYFVTGRWRAMGFSGFGGAASSPIASLTYIPATTHTVQALVQQKDTPGQSDVSYTLGGFAGIDQDKMVAAFVRVQVHSSGGSKQYWEARAKYGGDANYRALGGSFTYNSDDDCGNSGMAIIPINNASQSNLDFRLIGDNAGAGWAADVTDSLNWSNNGVEVEILGFWVAQAQSAAGTSIVYRSPWVSVDTTDAGLRVATYTHGLGDLPDFCSVYFRYAPSPGVFRVVQLSRTEDETTGDENNYSLTDLTTSELTIRWGAGDVSFIDFGESGEELARTTGEYRIVAGILSGNVDHPQLLATNQYLNPGALGRNWDAMTRGMDVTMTVDVTRPNRTAILQVDLYGEGPNVHPNLPTAHEIYVHGESGFSRQLFHGSTESDDRVGFGQQVFVRTDAVGAIRFEVVNFGAADFGNGRYRISLLGWF